MSWFKCKHPFASLVAGKKEELISADRDFERRVMFLCCNACGEHLTIRFLTLVGGVDGFLARGSAKDEACAT